MKKLIAIVMMSLPILSMFVGCKSGEDSSRETIEAEIRGTVKDYLYKNMKDPESLKILSCEVRKDTVPYWLSEDMFYAADEAQKAVSRFNYYSDMSDLFASEKYETATEARDAIETLKAACKRASENDTIDVEYIAYVKSSGNNPMGGTVSTSSIFIIDKDDPTKILGNYVVDSEFIRQFVSIKVLGEDYDFKQNKYGKYETEGMPYFEQFILNEAE